METRSREGCWTCRNRHKKCDGLATPCGNCSRLGLQCVRDTRLVWEDDTRRTGMRRRGPKGRSSHGGDGSEGAALAIAQTSSLQSTRILSSWPFRVDSTQSLLMDHYIQRFSITYPTFSGPTNPFLQVFLPLSTQSPEVLDCLLALGGVQSWRNGSFTMGKAMFRHRQRALEGCRRLASTLDSEYILDGEATLSSNATRNATQLVPDAANKEKRLYILTCCVLLMLYEKLAGEGTENGGSHLRFLSCLLRDLTAQREASSSALQFVSHLFLYNDLVRSTSLGTATLSDFYLSSSLEPMTGNVDKRFVFPQLIARISARDWTITDDTILSWDGNLGWLPSFALVRSEEAGRQEYTAMFNRETMMDLDYSDMRSFASLEDWSDGKIASELYRIAALAYKRQCGLNSVRDYHGEDSGNLPSWGTQLIQLLPPGSVYENALLWPMGIIAKQLTTQRLAERGVIITRLQSLEERFQMRHFSRIRNHLLGYWAALDQGMPHVSMDLVIFG